ncbi:MAG: hypothetical protein IJF33_06555, partial [Clostridia bacterium]|nr:hypothetical protein [Clostridia bacterium]
GTYGFDCRNQRSHTTWKHEADCTAQKITKTHSGFKKDGIISIYRTEENEPRQTLSICRGIFIFMRTYRFHP